MTLRAGAALALSVMLIALAWWWPNRATAEAFPQAKLDSVSFAPYRPGESPVAGVFPTPAQVAADIALLAPHVRAVRVYAARNGAADIPALAQAQGLKVWQGIWLGANAADNAREIAAGIALANRYPDTIDRVIVGNEVLLRHDMTPDQLIATIERVRAAIRQPVAYAEVEDYWRLYPQIAPHVDQMLVHLLPYWEDQPLGIDRAAAQELAYFRQLQALFPGKRMVVGETGWPTQGRWREDAAPGRVNAARYLREFTRDAARVGIEVNLIEAFDQDWKVGSEGTVGASWGLWTADRVAKFLPGETVRDDPAWGWHAAASVLMGAVLLAARRRWPTARDCALGMVLGVALVWAWLETMPGALGADRQTAAAINLAAQAAMAWILNTALPPSSWPGLTRPPTRRGAKSGAAVDRIGGVTSSWMAGSSPAMTSWEGRHLLTLLQTGFLIAAVYLQIMLLTDPRYRDFPTAAFAVPLVAALFTLGRRSTNWPEAVIATALAATAVAGAVQEGMANRQSLTWCAAALLLSAPSMIALSVARAAPGRVMTRA